VTFQQALTKTRGGFLSRLFGRKAEEPITPEFVDELEEGLLRADLSVSLVDPLMAQIRDLVTTGELKTVPKALDAVRDVLVAELASKDSSLRTTTSLPRVVLVVGVNGSGKTTTAAKLAKRLKDEGESPLLAAADTFRAAAIDQLRIWADRAGVPVVAHAPGADPGAVVYDALDAAIARKTDMVIADTAGRLHTKADLMDELTKVRRIVDKRLPGARPETLFVLDATTGQNGLAQATAFHGAVGLTGIVLTKLDSTAKGGIVFAIEDGLKVPVRFVGVGEGINDLLPFDPEAFVDALFAEDQAPTG
jgi:fused signal recognition particle receptor